ncbi:glycosyltransferase family 9 protein [Prosthecobacter fluviatilis]|uniref:Glycosyltransferase family 9 protein n=1 Tax=Prosthecobacter fluviatilis TaxID=445931 RepID=A0ABW0KYK9_9BACT
MVKTLLISKVNQLGDNVVYLPVVQSLAKASLDWRIVVLTSPTAARLYEVCCPGVAVMSYETTDFNQAWRHPARLWRYWREVRSLKADACLLGSDQGSVAHLLGRMSGASLSVGPENDRVKLNALLNLRLPSEGEEHVAIHNWRIAQALMHRLELPELPATMPQPDLKNFGRDEHGSVVIHAGASRAYKRWPLERGVELANRLSSRHAVTWFEQGEAGEARLKPAVRKVKPGTLDELVRIMAGAKHFIGNNSGPMNIASALGVPGTIFNGPSTPNWDPPWHTASFDILRDPQLACQPCDLFSHPVNACQNKQRPMACMDRWSVDEVHRRIETRLAGI